MLNRLGNKFISYPICGLLFGIFTVVPECSSAENAAELRITYPTANARVRGPITFTVDASGVKGIAGVSYLLNGKTLYNNGEPAMPVSSAPYSYTWHTANVWDSFDTIQAVAEDASGNIIQKSAAVPFQIANKETTLRLLSPDTAQTLKGIVSWSLETDYSLKIDRGRRETYIWGTFIDGKQSEVAFSSNPQPSFTVDTARLRNGTHELFCALLIETKEDEFPHVGMSQVMINVDNGRAPMELHSNYKDLYLIPSASVTLGPKLIYTNGDEVTVKGAYKTSNPSVAVVDDNGVVTGINPGLTTVTINSDGLAANVNVTVNRSREFSHFSKDGQILTAYDPNRSIFLRTLFWLDDLQLASAPQLVSAVQQAGINALTTGMYYNPADSGIKDFSQWKDVVDELLNRTSKVAAQYNLSIFLIGDDIARTPQELFNSVKDPGSAKKIQYVFNWAKNNGRVVGVDMVDEVDILWGNTPMPTDGRWLSGSPPLPNGAFTTLLKIINGVPDRPMISWPVAGGADLLAVKNWLGNPNFSEFSTVYWQPNQFRHTYPQTASLYEQYNDIYNITLLSRMPHLQRDKPVLLLTGLMGPNYSKQGKGDQFSAGIDVMRNQGSSPEGVQAQIMLAVEKGMAGVRTYAYDSDSLKRQRLEAAPGGKDDLQTGADPFSVGVQRWQAMSGAFNLIKNLERYVLQPQGNALDLGDKIATGAKDGSSGRLFLATNFSELPEPANVNLAAYQYSSDSKVMRYRLTTHEMKTALVPGGTDNIVLAPGETVVYEFPANNTRP